MIVILGESASGKTSLVNDLIKSNPVYQKVVTYTTRPMRPGEVDGVDYHFVDEKTYLGLQKEGFFAESAEYRGWYYGTPADECKKPNSIIILTPHGLRSLKALGYEIISVYLYVDRRSRLINLLCRGDDIEEAYRRSLSDVGQFDGVEDEVDYIIDNTKYQMTEEDVLQCLKNILIVKSPETEYEQMSMFENGEKIENV